MSMSDRIARVALARNICTRILQLADGGRDEIAVLDGFLLRLELGQQRYGALDLSKSKRDWDREADEEIADWAVYRALKRTAVHYAAVRRVESGLDELFDVGEES
jgi:hypothetical protein